MIFWKLRRPGRSVNWDTNGPPVWVNPNSVMCVIDSANGGSILTLTNGTTVEVMQKPTEFVP